MNQITIQPPQFFRNDMKLIKIRGENVIPFSLPDNKLRKHGGGFLSGHFKSKSSFKAEVNFKVVKRHLSFYDVSTAFLASKAKYIEDENKRREYVVALSGKLNFEQSDRIKKKVFC